MFAIAVAFLCSTAAVKQPRGLPAAFIATGRRGERLHDYGWLKTACRACAI